MVPAIPPQAALVLNRLKENGYEAFAVGGCVRDTLLGRAPHDWDVATNALPEETKRVFADLPVVETGLKHGTVTVLSGGMPVEVTTYRIDGAYSDFRHPDEVRFTRSLSDDLLRRDFTINALAFSKDGGLVDLSGGAEDLLNGVIRCVGEPDARFGEDALRILRALRFSSQLGFRLEERTAESAVRNRALLENISSERIREEFVKLLCGDNAVPVLREFREIVSVFLPELRPSFGFEQRNPHHDYDVWEHTLHALEAAKPEPELRLAVLLHDIGKPFCFTEDENGIGHFYGHSEKSAELAETILTRLRFDRKTAETVKTIVANHSLPLEPEEKYLRRRLNQLGEENLSLLVKMEQADAMGKGAADSERLGKLNAIPALLDRMAAEGQCFRREDLAVNGDDLLALGVPRGKEIGIVLARLLGEVLDGKTPNTRAALLSSARKSAEGGNS